MAEISDADFDRLKTAVKDVGREHGAALGSWVIDGNTSRDAAQAIVNGLQMGDPTVYDQLPQLQMGEWADDPTENDIVSDAVYRAKLKVDPNGLAPEEMDELINEYQDGWVEGRDGEVERSALAIL